MEVAEIKPWLFRVEPYQGESLSHFLGRFRQANDLTPTGLGKAAGLGSAIARWEKFRFNPPPSHQQLEALAKVVGVDVDRLLQMLPPAGVGMKMEPIRLCAACYIESPCHRIEWQLKVTLGCVGEARRTHSHNLSLLSECPNCGARFKVPALWVDGWCQRCFMTFPDMAQYQKHY
ncbi:helix-turn-helix domain-containing protein [Nostoc sp.]|uniref:helix-turn-helix domain-containing protein n=1 Tax=Nostoc sp. TaxID=1180 RepID=UPI002FF754E1